MSKAIFLLSCIKQSHAWVKKINSYTGIILQPGWVILLTGRSLGNLSCISKLKEHILNAAKYKNKCSKNVPMSQSLNHISTSHVLKISALPQSYASFVNGLFKGWLIYDDSLDGSPWPQIRIISPSGEHWRLQETKLPSIWPRWKLAGYFQVLPTGMPCSENTSSLLWIMARY